MNERPRRTESRLVLTESQINTIAGAMSGVFVSVLVSPLDVVRTRIQVKRLPKGVPNTPLLVVMYRLSQREGFRAFYKGLGATMLVSNRKSTIRWVRLPCRVTCRIGQFTSLPINGRKHSLQSAFHTFATNMICWWIYLHRSRQVQPQILSSHRCGPFVRGWWLKRITTSTVIHSMRLRRSIEQKDFTLCTAVCCHRWSVW